MNLIYQKYLKYDSLNPKKIDELNNLGRDLNEDVLRQMLDLHFATSDEMSKNIQKFYSEKKYDLLKREVHKFKSNCGNLGLEKLFSICKDFEKYLENSQLENTELENYIQCFQSEYEVTCYQLKEIKKGA